jgi:hypothetical protein
MQLISVSVTLDVVIPGDRGCLDAARDTVTKALLRIVNPEEKGMAITGASVDRVVRR